MQAAGDYHRDGYALVERLVPPEVGRAFLHQLKSDIEASDCTLARLAQTSALLKRPAVELYGFNYPSMMMFLWALTPAMCHLTGRDLLPSYNYLRIYRRGDICRVHTDRPACEYSLSLTLDYSDGHSWPLEVGTERLGAPEHDAQDSFRGAPFASLSMQPGDAVLYRGVFHRHGRTVPNPNDWSAHLFLHWVEREGPFADFSFDRHRELTRPVSFTFHDEKRNSAMVEDDSRDDPEADRLPGAPAEPGGTAAAKRAALVGVPGSAEAALTEAVMEAMGAGRPQSWERSFAALRVAADLGSTSARAQQELLGRGGPPDAAALLTAPPRDSLSERPRIRMLKAFATPAECDWLIGLARDKLAPARVWDPATGAGRRDPNRTNRALELTLTEMDVVVAVIRARISAATNIPVPVFEPPQLMHYGAGEEFRPHHDFLDPAQPGHTSELARFGQRIATFLLYLNDDYDGGETVFPRVGLSHRGRKGDALLFANVDAATRAPDPLTLHAGTAPTHGEKWIFSQWIRDRSPGEPR